MSNKEKMHAFLGDIHSAVMDIKESPNRDIYELIEFILSAELNKQSSDVLKTLVKTYFHHRTVVNLRKILALPLTIPDTDYNTTVFVDANKEGKYSYLYIVVILPKRMGVLSQISIDNKYGCIAEIETESCSITERGVRTYNYSSNVTFPILDKEEETNVETIITQNCEDLEKIIKGYKHHLLESITFDGKTV